MKHRPNTEKIASEAAGLLRLLAEIRAAVGDPEGKLMQDELVEHCRKLAAAAGPRMKHGLNTEKPKHE